MKKLVLNLEYGTTPIWIMDEDETEVLDNDIPAEWENETELLNDLDKLCEVYHSLFTDNEKEFSYNGFSNKKQEEEFKQLVDKVRNEVKAKLPEGYQFSDWVAKFDNL